VRIKMMTAIAGIRWSAKPGDEIDLDEATARRLLKSGQAIPVRQELEMATIKPPEAAVTRRRK